MFAEVTHRNACSDPTESAPDRSRVVTLRHGSGAKRILHCCVSSFLPAVCRLLCERKKSRYLCIFATATDDSEGARSAPSRHFEARFGSKALPGTLLEPVRFAFSCPVLFFSLSLEKRRQVVWKVQSHYLSVGAPQHKTQVETL